MADEDASAEQWRVRYYESLEQLEAREKEWQQIEQLLRQYISRLTLAADTTDKTLNKQLETLRRALRGGQASSELGPMMDALSTSIARLDRERAEGLRNSPQQLLLEMVDAFEFPRGMQRRANGFRKQVAMQDSGESFKPLIDDFITLISDGLASKVQKKSGLFSKFLGGDGEQGEAQGEYHHVTPMEDILAPARNILGDLVERLVEPQAKREAEILQHRLEEAEAESDLSDVAREMAVLLRADQDLPPHEVLLQLLERLGVPSELNEHVESIKTSLADGLEPDRVEPTLGSIADLVTEMRTKVQSEKQELEDFLKQLTANLQELDQNFRATVATHRESYQGGQELHTKVNEQMRGIEDSVQSADDLGVLKKVVVQRVSTIREHMVAFRKAEDTRLQRAEREAEALRTRMGELEKETSNLRQRVQQERRQALIDPLTGIYNRLAYNERVDQEFIRWQRYRTPLVMMVWDVDRFKNVNDTYGHQAGDKVLRVVAKLLSSQVRQTDFVARFGGEEFVALMPETEAAVAVQVAEKLRESIERAEFHHRKQRVPITISCGIAAFDDGDDVDRVFARADAALYSAKEQGRNRCMLAE